MCRGFPAAAAAPLQRRQQQRPPWPSPAQSSPASCKVRGCGGLRDAPSGSIPDPVRSSPRHTPTQVPPAPALMRPGCRQPPAPQLGASLSPEHPPLPSLPHPVRTFLSRSRPSRSSVTGAVSPLALRGLTLSDPDPPLNEASSSPYRESGFPHRAEPGPPRRTMGAAPGPDRLLAPHPPCSRPRPGTGPGEPPYPPCSAQTSGAKKGVREEGLDSS